MSDIRPLNIRIVGLLVCLVVANIVCLLAAWSAFHVYGMLFSTTLLAYGFGLRHAVDADHISAIDNTTRKLMQEGKRPVGVGFWFSLGHSTVVILLCAGLSLSATYVQHHLRHWQAIGGTAGTLVSGFFLFLIGFINLLVLADLYAVLKRTKRGQSELDVDIDPFLNQRGLLGRMFRPVLRMIHSSWQMYFVGFLFGLGFDTATEVGLLALSAHSSQVGLPFWSIMLLPILFTAGMCLVDTADGILMLKAYGWAFITPMRKLYYNFSITSLSVVVAFLVGSYELLQIAGQQLSLQGQFWTVVNRLNFSEVGYIIIVAFISCWAISAAISKLRRCENA
jgi:high-affinity nickel-transport protein